MVVWKSGSLAWVTAALAQFLQDNSPATVYETLNHMHTRHIQDRTKRQKLEKSDDNPERSKQEECSSVDQKPSSDQEPDRREEPAFEVLRKWDKRTYDCLNVLEGVGAIVRHGPKGKGTLIQWVGCDDILVHSRMYESRIERGEVDDRLAEYFALSARACELYREALKKYEKVRQNPQSQRRRLLEQFDSSREIGERQSSASAGDGNAEPKEVEKFHFPCVLLKAQRSQFSMSEDGRHTKVTVVQRGEMVQDVNAAGRLMITRNLASSDFGHALRNEGPVRVQSGQQLPLDNPAHGHNGAADEIEAAPVESQESHDAANHHTADITAGGEQSSLSPGRAGNGHLEVNPATSLFRESEHFQIPPNEISSLGSELGEAELVDAYLLELASLDAAGNTPAVDGERDAVLDVPPILDSEENCETERQLSIRNGKKGW